MSPEEIAVVDALGVAFNLFSELPVIHHADLPEFIHAIHAAQNIVLAREGLRATGIYRPMAPKQQTEG